MCQQPERFNHGAFGYRCRRGCQCGSLLRRCSYDRWKSDRPGWHRHACLSVVPATGLSSATDPNPVATPASATGYTVVVTDANGCSSSATVQVDIDATPAPVITMSGDTLYTSGGVTYEWYLNGNLAGSGASPFFVATQSGNYEVVAYSAAGCAGVSPVFAFTPTGIYSSALLAGINVFPNPARDEFQITLPAGSGSVVARLMDLTGKKCCLRLSTNNIVRSMCACFKAAFTSSPLS